MLRFVRVHERQQLGLLNKMLRGATRDMIDCHTSDEQRGRWSNATSLLTAPLASLVVVGDVIQANPENALLRGHGTQLVDGQLVATVCGAVERVNKLVSVRPLRSRYEANVGHVVVGRVVEVAQNRWKVDINAKQHANLMLSSVNLPGGIQRRRTAVDELNMRSVFVESDLISAEVQGVNQDGSVHLQTRSSKYGKLQGGQLIQVPSYLIKRLNQHFHQFKQWGVEAIFAYNGNVWVSGPSTETDTSLETREKICRVANAVRVLSQMGLLISPDSVSAIVEESTKSGTEIRDMLSPDFHLRILEIESLRRTQGR